MSGELSKFQTKQGNLFGMISLVYILMRRYYIVFPTNPEGLMSLFEVRNVCIISYDIHSQAYTVITIY